jgi:hypothetical protein
VDTSVGAAAAVATSPEAAVVAAGTSPEAAAVAAATTGAAAAAAGGWILQPRLSLTRSLRGIRLKRPCCPRSFRTFFSACSNARFLLNWIEKYAQ